MPKADAYLANLTVTHVHRIEELMKFLVDCEIKEERQKCVYDIQMILRSKKSRRSIGPKVKELAPFFR